MVFLALAAFSGLRTALRLLSSTVVVFLAVYFGYWQIFLFSAGMLLADLNFCFQGVGNTTEHTPSSTEETEHLLPSHAPSMENIPLTRDHIDRRSCVLGVGWFRIMRSPGVEKIILFTSFIFAIHLLSMPEGVRGAAVSPGYITIMSLTPTNYSTLPEYFWIPVGAVLLVLTVDRAPFLQKIFTNRFSQYLGRISFSLYLIHGPLLWTYGLQLGKFWVRVTGQLTDASYCLGIFFALCCYWPVAITLADFVSRAVDSRAVNLGRWAYQKMTPRT
jgi:hypothetical protein